MKTINAYEYDDLNDVAQKRVFDEELNSEIEFDIECLTEQLTNGLLTEDEYYRILGCTKYYAETTSWFIPSCYYKKNKKYLEDKVNKHIRMFLFTVEGRCIQKIK